MRGRWQLVPTMPRSTAKRRDHEPSRFVETEPGELSRLQEMGDAADGRDNTYYCTVYVR